MVRLGRRNAQLGFAAGLSVYIAICCAAAFAATADSKDFARDFVMPATSLIANSPRQPLPGDTWVTSAPKFACQSSADVNELASAARDRDDFSLLLAAKLFVGRCSRIDAGATVHIVTREQSGLVCLRLSSSQRCDTSTPLDLSPLPL